jgi:hypothetical protein
MPQGGFEPTSPVFEWAKTVNALDRAAAVICPCIYYILNCQVKSTTANINLCFPEFEKYTPIQDSARKLSCRERVLFLSIVNKTHLLLMERWNGDYEEQRRRRQRQINLPSIMKTSSHLQHIIYNWYITTLTSFLYTFLIEETPQAYWSHNETLPLDCT